MLRNLVFVVAAIVLAIVSGCGGGGGGGGLGGGTGVIAAPGQYIEFLRAGGGWFDPFNLLIGNSGTAVLANYDSLGNRTLLTASGWTTTAGGGFISINSGSGAFTVISAPAGEFKFQTTSTILGTPTLFEQRGRVPSAVASVTGRVVELGLFSGNPTSNGVPHVDVDIYTAGGVLVGSARTMEDGRFTAIVPTTARLIMAEPNSIKTSKYYRSIYYQLIHYSPFDTDCRIDLGVIVVGPNTMPSVMGVPQTAGGPPPPPGGCS